jgi:CheY-like chemotaxis protein
MHCSCSFPAVLFIALGIFWFIRWMKKIDQASRETAERMYDPTEPADPGPDLLEEVSRPPPAPFPEPPPTPVTKGFVLVADDSQTIQNLVSLVLRPEGYGILPVMSGTEAWQQILSKKPALVIAEENLPGLDGYELAEKIRFEPATRALPVVLLTGPQPDVQRAKRYGVHATVPKPFESEELLVAVTEALAAAAVKPACPVCNDLIEGESAVCPWCKAAHHPECFALNDGCGKCEFTTS